MDFFSHLIRPLLLVLALLVSACGTGTDATSSATGSVSSDTTDGGNPASSIDPHKLPVGTPYVTTSTPAPGWLYVCATGNGPGASAMGPWFDADGKTWDPSLKIAVQGAITWESNFTVEQGSALELNGNGLPAYPTGNFPIAPSDPAHAYDRNPNRIRSVNIAWSLPAAPQIATKPTCLNMGPIGVLLSGVRLFNAADEAGRDAVAWEIQDSCQGHPEQSGAYHHHSVSSCISQKDQSGQHSPLVGYVADGFGLYGNQGEGGKALTDADLDNCHGHSHVITVNGVTLEQYHYHQTQEFPYTVGCYEGTPAEIH